MGSEQSTQAEPRYAWVIVGVTAVMQVAGFGALANMAVFLKPLAADLGWLRGELAFSYFAITLGTGLGGILMGALSDRWPTGRIVLFGAVCMGAFLYLMSTVQALWQLYLYSVLLGFFGIAAVGIPTVNLMGMWLSRNLGFAFGITSAGGAIGQGFVPFIAANLIVIYGWRDAYGYLGIAYLIVLMPLALLVRQPSQPVGDTANAGAPAAPELPQFGLSREKLTALMSLAVIFCCITMATPIMHVAPLASDLGFSPEIAAGVLTTMMVFGVFGRLLAGWSIDRLGGIQTYAVVAFAQTVLVFWFTRMESVAGLYAMAAVFGLGYSGVMTCIIYCGRYFSPAGKSGLALGVVVFFAYVGMGLGSYQAGLFYDLTGNYTVSYLNSVFSGLINLTIIAVIYHYAVRKPARLAVQPA